MLNINLFLNHHIYKSLIFSLLMIVCAYLSFPFNIEGMKFGNDIYKIIGVALSFGCLFSLLYALGHLAQYLYAILKTMVQIAIEKIKGGAKNELS